MAAAGNPFKCLVKAPISTLYRDGKAVDPQPVVGQQFDFTEDEMLRIRKSNPRALALPQAVAAESSNVVQKDLPALGAVAQPVVKA